MAESSISGNKRLRIVETTINPEPCSDAQPKKVSDLNDPHEPRFELPIDKLNMKCKIANRCKWSTSIKYIKDQLSDHPSGYEWFMQSQFAPLFFVAEDMDVVLVPLWMLATRMIKSSDDSAVWFVVNGIPIRYSLMEHALMTGLNCSSIPEGSNVVGEDSFVKRHLHPKASLNILKSKLEGCLIGGRQKIKKKKLSDSSSASVEDLKSDKLKLALTYFLASIFFIPSTDDAPIDPMILAIVDDLVVAKDYPWGRLSFSQIVKQLKNLDIKKISGAKNPQWSILFFVLPLMLLPLECIPTLTPQIGRLRQNVPGKMPRMCKWTTRLCTNSSPTMQLVLYLVGNTRDIKSIIKPTEEEMLMDYMESFSPFDDSHYTDTTKLWNQTLEAGGNIFYESIFLKELAARNSGAPVSDVAGFIECSRGPEIASIPFSSNSSNRDEKIDEVLRRFEIVMKDMDFLKGEMRTLHEDNVSLKAEIQRINARNDRKDGTHVVAEEEVVKNSGSAVDKEADEIRFNVHVEDFIREVEEEGEREAMEKMEKKFEEESEMEGRAENEKNERGAGEVIENNEITLVEEENQKEAGEEEIEKEESPKLEEQNEEAGEEEIEKEESPKLEEQNEKVAGEEIEIEKIENTAGVVCEREKIELEQVKKTCLDIVPFKPFVLEIARFYEDEADEDTVVGDEDREKADQENVQEDEVVENQEQNESTRPCTRNQGERTTSKWCKSPYATKTKDTAGVAKKKKPVVAKKKKPVAAKKNVRSKIK